MRIRWDDLRVFLAVARRESLSGAGRELMLDPATVGRRMAALEETLDRPLFVKSPQGYQMTDAGQTLLQHAEQVETSVFEGVEAMGAAARGLSGQVRIGAPDGCANFLLPQVCAQIARDNPGLDIQIVALPRVVNLSKREADIAVAVSPPTAGRLSVQGITDYHLHLAATRDYLARSAPITCRGDLLGHSMVGYIQDMIFDKELDYLAEVGVGRVDLASNSVAVQFNWLRQGAGIGIVHDFAMPQAPDLIKVLPEEVALKRRFYLVRHQDDRRLDSMNRLADLLVTGLRHEVARLERLT